MDTTELVDIPQNRGLDEFAPETHSPDESSPASLVLVVQGDVSPATTAPRPFSRLESAVEKRATSSAAMRKRWTVSPVTTRGSELLSVAVLRGRRAFSSVLVRSGRAVSSAAIGTRRTVSSVARRSTAAAASAAAHGRRGISTAASHSARGAGVLGHDAAAVSRAMMGYVWAAIALVALRCDSWAYAAARAVRAGRAKLANLRTDATPTPEAGLRHLESEGAVVAAALALAAVSYGAGALLLSWRDPVPRPSELAISAPGAMPIAVAPLAVPASVVTASTAVPGDLVPPATVQPAAVRLSAASLKAVWNRGDTRSLHGALTNLRYRTLALHRCGMKMTAADRAVARCDGSNSARYTIDFRRTKNRWVIQRVSSR